jgi:hypothetical protein
MVSLSKVKDISKNIFNNLKNIKRQSKQITELNAERIYLLEKLAENNKLIRTLKTALENNGEIVSENCAYWRKDDLGNIIEGPFCMSCFITESALRPLVRAEKPHNIDGVDWEWVRCIQCKAPFPQRQIGRYLQVHGI